MTPVLMVGLNYIQEAGASNALSSWAMQSLITCAKNVCLTMSSKLVTLNNVNLTFPAS